MRELHTVLTHRLTVPELNSVDGINYHRGGVPGRPADSVDGIIYYCGGVPSRRPGGDASPSTHPKKTKRESILGFEPRISDEIAATM